MIHTVTDNVHQRILNTVYNGLIYFSFLSDNGETYVLVKFLLHIPDDSVHLLEYAGYGNHSQGHGNILKVVSELA